MPRVALQPGRDTGTAAGRLLRDRHIMPGGRLGPAYVGVTEERG